MGTVPSCAHKHPTVCGVFVSVRFSTVGGGVARELTAKSGFGAARGRRAPANPGANAAQRSQHSRHYVDGRELD
jgi:hypothetical protein